MRRKTKTKILALTLAASLLSGAMPVYAEGVTNVLDESTEKVEGNSNEGAEAYSEEVVQNDETVRWNILDDAFVHNASGKDMVVRALDETDRVNLAVGNSRMIFLRFDLLQAEADRQIEYAKLCLYKQDTNTNTVLYDRAFSEKEWEAENLTSANMPAWEGEPRYQATVSGKDKYVEIDLTELVREALEQGETELEVKIDMAEGAKYPSGFYSSRCDTEEQKPYFEVKYAQEMSDEEKVREVVDEIKAMDGMYLSQTVAFPFFDTHENGATVTWKSDSDALLPDGTMNIPDDGNASVNLTATITSGDVTQEVTIGVTVLKKQSVSPYAEQSLRDLIEYAGQTMEAVSEAEDMESAKPGTLDKEKGDVLRAVLNEAEAALDEQTKTAYSAYCSTIISIGKEYFSSGKISDEVVKTSKENNGNGNLLEYSEYRAKLEGLVWAARAQLMCEPQMYTMAAKRSLEEQIEEAESALDGTYQFPYGRSREFLSARDDEAIQFVTGHKVVTHNYNSNDYGLEPVLTWYKSENIAASSYITMDIEPVYATFINHGSSNKNDIYGNYLDSVAVGKGSGDRVALLQFDLRQIPDSVVSAQLKLTTKKNGGKIALNLEEDNWDGNAVSGKIYEELYGQNFSPRLLTKFTTQSAGKQMTLDVTDAVTGQFLQDQKISFSLSAVEANYPIDFYGTSENVEEGYRPVLTVTVASAQENRLEEKYKEVLELIEEFRSGAQAGEEKGQYPAEYLDAVNETADRLVSLYNSGERDVYVLGKAMVDAQDAVREARDNRILNLDDGGNLFMNEEDIENIREKTETVEELAEIKETVMETADLYTSAELKEIYELVSNDKIQTLNENGYKVWSQIKSINFNAPEGTAQAYIQVSLSPEDYEGNGIGHAWLDDIEIIPSRSNNADIPNADFEEKDSGWNFVKENNTQGQFDDTYAFSGTGSLYIENTGENADGYWKSDSFALEEDSFELRFKAKYDDKFKGNGLNIVVHFLDKDGSEIGTTDPLGKNTKSALVLDTAYMSGYQTAAIAYMLTGDQEYAKKSFWYMMLFLDDHLQGVEYWLINNARPDGFDNYGGVQEGRNANTLATAYSLIKDADLFGGDEELEQNFYTKVEYLLSDLLDLRDRMELAVDEVAVGSSNWQTDMSIGAAMLAMSFYDKLDNAQQYIDNGKYIVQGQLHTSVREDGAWPESIRYHVTVVSKMAMFAKALRNVTGEDWFSPDSPVQLAKMMKFLVEVQTPAYADGNIDAPVVGDDSLGAGDKFSLLGCYWDEVAKENPELGQQMYETWVKAGSPLGNFGSEDNILQNFFLNPDFEDEYEWVDEYELALESSDYAAPFGIYQLRNHYGTGNDTYLAFIANEEAIGHNHYDQLSFSMYYNSTPLVVDPGIETYFGSSKGTYMTTGSHATVQFANEKGFADLGTTSYDRSMSSTELLDQVQASTAYGDAVLTRTIAYAKTDRELFVIRDRISGGEYQTRWNLPVAAENMVITDENRIDIEGFDGVRMTVLMLEGSGSIETEQIRGAGELPVKSGKTSPLVDVLHVNGSSGQSGYLSVLIPYVGDAAEITYELAETSEDGYRLYRIEAGEDIYLLAVNDTGEEHIQMLGSEVYTALDDGSKAEGEITVGAGQMRLLQVGYAEDEPEKTADKTLLQKVCDYAEGLSTEGVVDSAKEYFEKALAEAQTVLADPDAEQTEVDKAMDNLLEGIFGLGIVKGDKTNLEILIDRAQSMMEYADKFAEANWQQLVDALAAAEQVYADGDALKEDVEKAADSLLNAILVQRYKANKDNLQRLVDSLAGIDLSKYTDESVRVFRVALAQANAVLEDDTLTQDNQNTVDTAEKELKAARDGLVEKTGGTDDGGDTGDDGDTGDSGNAGNAGDTGDTGNTGNTGDTGAVDNNDSGTDSVNQAVQTGDNANIMLPAAALVLAAAAGGVTVVRKRKKK